MTTRSRTITWEDPVSTFGRAAGLTGLEYLRALAAREIPPPPIAETMAIWPVEVEVDRVVFECEPAEFHYNPIGLVHGGLAATLLDSVMGCAVQTRLDAGVGYSTLDLSVRYLRPMTRDTGLVRAVGTLVHLGRTTATAEGRILAAGTGKLLATATTTCLVSRAEARPQPEAGAVPAD
jgi:uncharacterized protein (TIGR00369 family)